MHDGQGLKRQDMEGEMLLEFTEARSMAIMSKCFVRVDDLNVTYESSGP